MIHGTYTTYAREGCRCAKCATQQRERVRRNRAERLASSRLNHGTRASYDCGCRCEPCRDARKAAYPAENAVKRQQYRESTRPA
jgi:hypothetical protein